MIFIVTYQKYILGGVFLLIFLWENILPQRYFPELSKHNNKNFVIGAVNLLLTFILGIYFSMYLDWLQRKHEGVIKLLALPPLVRVVIALLIADILMYWWHRINHTTFLWRFHSFHHQDEQMNTTTGIRFHVVELVLSYAFRMFWYPFFGISSLMVIVFSTIHFSMIIFHHSNIRISPGLDKFIRLFIVSPGMHRIHHSNKWAETNSNYTSILSCWDWIFGSYVNEASEQIQFGIPKD